MACQFLASAEDMPTAVGLSALHVKIPWKHTHCEESRSQLWQVINEEVARCLMELKEDGREDRYKAALNMQIKVQSGEKLEPGCDCDRGAA